MKVKDYITEKDIDTREARRLYDNNYIYSSIYSEICDFLQKGLLTTKDIDNLKQQLKNYVKSREYYWRQVRREALDCGKRSRYYLYIYAGKEDNLSIEKFKKTRECLTMDEHKEIIELLSKDLNSSTVLPDSTRPSNLEGEYNAGLRFGESLDRLIGIFNIHGVD